MAQRTTITLHDDVYAALRREAIRTGRRFKDVVNETLRRGLERAAEGDRVALQTFSAAMLVDFSSTSSTLERLEGPDRR